MYASVKSMRMSRKTKLCKRCREHKRECEFYRMGAYLQPYCKPCVASRAREWQRENPERFFAHQLKKYGITVHEYWQMHASQSGTCNICDGECATGARLCVDHCHKTKKVRGLVCRSCNVAIGHLRDNLVLLERAAQHLLGDEYEVRMIVREK